MNKWTVEEVLEDLRKQAVACKRVSSWQLAWHRQDTGHAVWIYELQWAQLACTALWSRRCILDLCDNSSHESHTSRRHPEEKTQRCWRIWHKSSANCTSASCPRGCAKAFGSFPVPYTWQRYYQYGYPFCISWKTWATESLISLAY